MRVETLSTTQFRNLDHLEVSLSPGVNLFVGENGQGKTNLLEAVYLFKFGRSFRASRDAEMIHFGKTYCRVAVSCVYQKGDADDFAVSIEPNGEKRFKISGAVVAKLSDLIGRYPIVLFGPQDLRLTSGVPAERRRYADMVGSMTDRSYLQLLKDYRRIVNQRNAALRSKASRSERDAWNEKLVENGCALLVKRMGITATLRRYVLEHASGMETPFEFTVDYDSEVVRESTMLAGRGGEPGVEEMKAVFAGRLASLENEELRRGTTMVGPHRDDISLKISGRDVRRFGSQGQRRILAILMKLAELSHLEAELREPCVLLLDDVFSEFDREITGKLQRILEGDRQVFVTSPIPLDWATATGVSTFSVAAGKVTTA